MLYAKIETGALTALLPSIREQLAGGAAPRAFLISLRTQAAEQADYEEIRDFLAGILSPGTADADIIWGLATDPAMHFEALILAGY